MSDIIEQKLDVLLRIMRLLRPTHCARDATRSPCSQCLRVDQRVNLYSRSIDDAAKPGRQTRVKILTTHNGGQPPHTAHARRAPDSYPLIGQLYGT